MKFKNLSNAKLYAKLVEKINRCPRRESERMIIQTIEIIYDSVPFFLAGYDEHEGSVMITNNKQNLFDELISKDKSITIDIKSASYASVVIQLIQNNWMQVIKE